MSAIRPYLRALAQQGLLAAETIAGTNIFLPRTWPTNSAVMPNISIQTPREMKDDATRGNGFPHFVTVTWLQLRCQVMGTDAGQIEDDLETLVDQAEQAMMALIAVAPPAFTTPVSTAGTVGSNVLTFAKTPPLLWFGHAVADTTSTAIPTGTKVKWFSPGSVWLSANIAAPGVALGDAIQFTPQRPAPFRRIVRGDYEMSLTSEAANHLGEAVLTFGFEHSETFPPIITDRLQGMNITATDGPGGETLATATIDLPTS
jgi:hypothetical protein